LHVGPLLDGQRVDDAVKRRAHAGFAERVCGSFVGGLGFGALSVNFCGLGLGVAVFLLLLEQSGVRLGALQGFFGLLDFRGRGCALLLQAAKRVEMRWASLSAPRALIS